MSAPILLFLVFGSGAVLAAVAMVLLPNPVRSALFLVVNLFCVATLYLLLNAYFLATVQVIVYAGAIMVLFLFVIMLLNLGTPDRSVDRLRWQQPIAVLAAFVLAICFGWAICSSVPAGAPATEMAAGSRTAAQVDASVPAYVTRQPDQMALAPQTPDTMGTVIGVGNNLYDPNQTWLFPFEVTSILLLIAVIGAVVLARRRAADDPEPAGASVEGGI